MFNRSGHEMGRIKTRSQLLHSAHNSGTSVRQLKCKLETIDEHKHLEGDMEIKGCQGGDPLYLRCIGHGQNILPASDPHMATTTKIIDQNGNELTVLESDLNINSRNLIRRNNCLKRKTNKLEQTSNNLMSRIFTSSISSDKCNNCIGSVCSSNKRKELTGLNCDKNTLDEHQNGAAVVVEDESKFEHCKHVHSTCPPTCSCYLASVVSIPAVVKPRLNEDLLLDVSKFCPGTYDPQADNRISSSIGFDRGQQQHNSLPSDHLPRTSCVSCELVRRPYQSRSSLHLEPTDEALLSSSGKNSRTELSLIRTNRQPSSSEFMANPQKSSNNDKQPFVANQLERPIHINWRDISQRYGKMPIQDHKNDFLWKMRRSPSCHVFLSTLNIFFPILSSLRDYKLPGDLLNDIITGLTIAVLHIPQGMAYGLLAGVEPIFGLYVSFVPVLIMAFMSKSRHVSYGTFAIISMLLANATDSVKLILKKHFASSNHKTLSESLDGSFGQSHDDLRAIVLKNNHQSADNAFELKKLASSVDEVHTTADSNFSWTVSGSSNSLWPFESSVDFIMPSNIEILSYICILVGLSHMVMALFRLGILSLMFSDQLISSFTTASAFHVVTSQIGGLFDLSLPAVPESPFKVCRTWLIFGKSLLEGFNKYTALLSLTSIIFLLAIKEIAEPLLRRRFKTITCLPSELILMSSLIFSSWYWQFNSVYDISIIGNVPTGLPTPRVPRLDLIPLAFQDAITIAFVSFAMNLSLAQVYAKKFKYKLDPNQELFAIGTANFVSSFFSCFPCASSLSRSAIQSNLNVKSPLCSIFSCALVVSMICYFAPILHDLPRSTLSCIIVVALKGTLVQVKDLGENWRLSKLDAFVWMATFISILAFGVIYGLVLGIALSLFTVFVRLLNPNHSILGQLPGTEIYVDTSAFLNCHQIDQVKIFRFNSALCYLNRTMLKSCIEKSLPSIYNPNNFCSMFPSNRSRSYAAEKSVDKINYLIIDCSALAYCDYSGAATLVDIIEELEEYGVNVYLAACPLKLVTMIGKMQKTDVIDQNVYPSITDAINYVKYLKTHRAGENSGSL